MKNTYLKRFVAILCSIAVVLSSLGIYNSSVKAEDNTTEETAETVTYAKKEVLAQNDYSTAGTWGQSDAGAGSRNVTPTTDPLDSSNKVLIYQKSWYGDGALFLGSDYKTKDVLTNSIKVQKGASYHVQFDYYVKGTVSAEVFTLYLAAGTNSGSAVTYDKTNAVLIEQYAVNTIPTMNGWVTKTATITIPDDYDTTTYPYLMLCGTLGGGGTYDTTRLRAYFDNVKVTTASKVTGTVIAENDYDDALAVDSVNEGFAPLSSQMYPKTETVDGTENRYIYYAQYDTTIGVLRLGHTYENKSLTDYTPIKVKPGQTYYIEFDYRLKPYLDTTTHPEWPTTDLTIGVAVGPANESLEGVYATRDDGSGYLNKYVSWYQDIEVLAASDSKPNVDWTHKKIAVTIPTDCDVSTYDSLQLYATLGQRCGLHIDNIKVIEVSSTEPIYAYDTVVAENDYTNAKICEDRWTFWNASMDLYPVADPTDATNTVLKHQQSGGYGFVVIGADYSKDVNTVLAQAVKAEKGKAYEFEFDYYVAGTPTNLYIATGVGAPSGDSPTISIENKLLSIDAATDGWIRDYKVIMTVPEDADFTNGDTLLLYAHYGLNQSQTYFDNVKVTELAPANITYEIDEATKTEYSASGVAENYQPSDTDTAIWYYDEDYTQKVDFNNFERLGEVGDITLYGKYAVKVTYYVNQWQKNNTYSYTGIPVEYEDSQLTSELSDVTTLINTYYSGLDTSKVEFDGWYVLKESGNVRSFGTKVTTVQEAVDVGGVVCAKWKQIADEETEYTNGGSYSATLYYDVDAATAKFSFEDDGSGTSYLKYTSTAYTTGKRAAVMASGQYNASVSVEKDDYAKLQLGTSYEVKFRYKVTSVDATAPIQIQLYSTSIDNIDYGDSYCNKITDIVTVDSVTDGWVDATAYFTVDELRISYTYSRKGTDNEVTNTNFLSMGMFGDALAINSVGVGEVYFDGFTVTALSETSNAAIRGNQSLNFTIDSDKINGIVHFEDLGNVDYDKTAQTLTWNIDDYQPDINNFDLNNNKVYQIDSSSDSGKVYAVTYANEENNVSVKLFDKTDENSGSNFSLTTAEGADGVLRYLVRAYSEYADSLYHNGVEYTVAERGVLIKRTQKAYSAITHNDMLLSTEKINKVSCDSTAYNITSEFYDYSVAINGLTEKYDDTNFYVRGYMVLTNGTDSIEVYTDNILCATPSTVSSNINEMDATYSSDSKLNANGIESVTLSLYENGEDAVTYGLAWILEPDVKEDVEPTDTITPFVQFVETDKEIADFENYSENEGVATPYRVKYIESDEDYYNDKVLNTSGLNKIAKYYYVRSNKATMELTRGKSYKYRVGYKTEDGTVKYSKVGTVQVPSVEEASDGSFKFLYMADIQAYNSPENVWGKTLDKALANFSPEFMINGGDIIQWSGFERNWTDVLEANSQVVMNIPQVAVSGNHEFNMSTKAENYAVDMHFNICKPESSDTTSGVYYSYDYENTHFVILNSNEAYIENRDNNSYKISDAQYDWLKEDLESAKTRKTNGDIDNIIVSTHHSLYGYNAAYDDALALGLRSQLTKLFADNNVDLVLQAHDHRYTRTHSLDAQGTVVQEASQDVYGKDAGVVYVTVLPAGTQTTTPASGKTDMGDEKNLYAAYTLGKGGVGGHAWTEISIDGKTITVTSYSGATAYGAEKDLVDTFTITDTVLTLEENF